MKVFYLSISFLSLFYFTEARSQDPPPPFTPAIQKKVDSLNLVLQQSKPDSNRVLALYEMATWYGMSYRFLEAYKWSEKTLKAAEEIHFERGICLGYHLMGTYSGPARNFKLFLDYGNKLLELAKKIGFKKGEGLGYQVLSNYYFYNNDYDAYLKNATAAIKILEQEGDRRSITPSLSMMAVVYRRKGNLREAQNYYYNAAAGWKDFGGLQYEAATYSRMGDIFLQTGENYQLAIEYKTRALGIFKSIKYNTASIFCYLDIGEVYMKANDDTAAEQNFKTALLLNEGQKDSSLTAAIDISFGKLFLKQRKFDEALDCFMAAQNIYKSSEDYKDDVAFNYKNIASLYKEKGDLYWFTEEKEKAATAYREARLNYLNALNYFEHKAEKIFTGDIQLSIAEIDTRTGNRLLAQKYLQSALETALSFGVRETIAQSYLLLSRFDSAAGNYAQAYEGFKKYQLYRDSLSNADNIKKMEAIKLKEDFALREKELLLLSSENKLKTAVAEKQRQKKTFAYGMLGAILFLGLFGFYRYRRHSKEQADQKLLSERLAISQDLHDHVGSTLSSISVFSKVAQVETEKGNTVKANELLDKVRDTSAKMINEMNDIVWAINPGNDTMEKIIQRMESFARPLLTARNMQFHFNYDEAVKSLNLEMEQRKNFFLIFKEAVNNAIKYSGGNLLEANIVYRQGLLELNVKDNGVGFNVEKEMNNAASLSGNGLKNMMARAKEMNASLQIDSISGSGTTVRLLLPVL